MKFLFILELIISRHGNTNLFFSPTYSLYSAGGCTLEKIKSSFGQLQLHNFEIDFICRLSFFFHCHHFMSS
jgi:hypothetical protein